MCSWCSHCAPLVLVPACWQKVDVDQPAADPVQHLELFVDLVLFKAVPFQTVEQRLYSYYCHTSLQYLHLPNPPLISHPC